MISFNLNIYSIMILEKDNSGSYSVQITVLTSKIKALDEHIKTHIHDYDASRTLIRLVEKRKRFLKYLKRYNEKAYYSLLSTLNLRK